MLGYEFVSLTPEQVEARRKALDQAGFNGYLLPIILLSTVYTLRLLSPFTSSGSDDGKTSTKPNTPALFLRRLKWYLGQTVLPEFGPLHVQVFGAAYIAALLYLIVKGTSNDYMHVTKAFGHVAVSQLPVHYLLAIKQPQSPITLATGLTHERLNAHHRLLGRIIHVLLITHGALYMYYFIEIGVLMKRINDWDVRYGLSALVTMDLIGVLSIPQIRSKFYHKIFYRSHVLLTILLAVIVYLHVPYTTNYAAQAGFFWITNGVFRSSMMGEKASVKCRQLGSHLVEVVATLKSTRNWENWVPGMHGYINQSGLGPRTPFTVTAAAEKSGKAEIQFVVRNLGGPMTAVLGEAGSSGKALELEVEGPYGEAKQYLSGVMTRVGEQILVVAGGVGATYSLPIYLALSDHRKETTGLRLVWVVQNIEDAKWGLELLRGKANRNVHIYVTKGKHDDPKSVAALALPGITIHTPGKRPDLRSVVSDFYGPVGQSYQSAAVMVCGPGGLSTALRKAVTPYVWDGRKIRWYEEQFGFGGST